MVDLAALLTPALVELLTGAIGPAGVAGLTGAIGPAGVATLTVLVGPLGIAGLIGAMGIPGIAGAVGTQGIAGAIGITGPAGPPGDQGVQGPVGDQGAQGTPGVAGASGVSEYAYVYNNTAEIVAIDDDIDFDANGPISPTITHAPGSPTVMLTNAGTYAVFYSVSGVEPNQFTVMVNGIPAVTTTYGSGAGTQQNTGLSIVTVLAGATTITLRNFHSAAAVTLQTLAGGTEPNVNASLLILRLA